MSGYIGGILILSGCFMYGLSYSQRLKIRITILKDMVRMLSVMNNHIGYSLIDMTQIFERLGDFDMCSYFLQDHSFHASSFLQPSCQSNAG